MFLLQPRPGVRLRHKRVLQSFGKPRGLAIIPVPGRPVRPAEIVYDNSAVVVSLKPGVAYVVEWTDSETALHHVWPLGR
jgi:hypothetical protein